VVDEVTADGSVFIQREGAKPDWRRLKAPTFLG
jgi:hypothetical protein